MKIRLWQNYREHPASEPWFSDELVNCQDALEAGQKIIDNFNNTLRRGEWARVLVRVDILDANLSKHEWGKASLMTEKGGYDRYRCRLCGGTGKRYGLSETVRADKPYKGSNELCPGPKQTGSSSREPAAPRTKARMISQSAVADKLGLAKLIREKLKTKLIS